MGKFDLSTVVQDIQSSLKREKRDSRLVSLGTNLPTVSRDPKDYVVMPSWWGETYGVLGLPFNKIVQISGDSDTGKSSLAITAMNEAQAQGIGVIYVETEGKTAPQDLLSWGVNPDDVMLINTNITEIAFDTAFRTIQAFFKNYPNERLLFIFDSFGNTISQHDEDMDLTSQHQKVGGAAKTNRLGLGRLVALMDRFPIAILIVNYTYDNIGSPGKTQAGGKALKFYTMIGINSQRTGDWIRTVKGEKVKAGAHVKWTTFKNHYQKSAEEGGQLRLLPQSVSLRISAKGIEKLADSSED